MVNDIASLMIALNKLNLTEICLRYFRMISGRVLYIDQDLRGNIWGENMNMYATIRWHLKMSLWMRSLMVCLGQGKVIPEVSL